MAAAISLVMTIYNRERYLATAIESILKQTRSDFELLIWDDGSTDASLEIARSYAQQDTRIRVIEATHHGRVLALKWAIEQTTGTYLGFIDSDDLLAPTALQQTAAILDAQPAIGWVYTDYLDIDEHGKILGYGHRCRIPYSPDRLLVDFMTHHFRLLRRSVYEQAGGLDSSMQVAEDYDLCLRLSEISKVQRVRKPLYLYRNHPENIGIQEKIVWSQEAIQRALKRRGLDQQFQIDVIRNHFILHRKRQPQRSMLQRAGIPLAALSLASAIALPQPAQAQRIDPARDGTGTEVRTRGNRHDITGGRLSGDGENLFHSFERFGLSEGEIANFLSRPEIVNILGRITGGEISFINGMLQITGGNSNLYLMNPAGIVFGPHATLDLPGSFTATTATGIGFGTNWFNAIGENNYALLNGNPDAFAFTTNQPGVIVNAGNLSVAPGQSLGLASGVVVNTGELSAPNGQLTAIAVPGQSVVRLSQSGNVLSLEVPIAPGSTQPNQWTLPISALPQLLTSGNAGQNLGLQVNQNGQVTLVDSGTEIPSTSGTTVVSGRLDASTTQAGETGGTIQVLGDRVGLVDAQVEATGTNGGGTVLVGGDYQGQGTVPNSTRTYVSRDSSINVSATQAGDGGRAIVWSDGTTSFYGEIAARGGPQAGDGGFVEVSGQENLVFRGLVDTSATNGSTGTLLLDPENIIIVNNDGGEGGDNDEELPEILSTDSPGETFTISEFALELQDSNVVLEATNDITLQDLTDLGEDGTVIDEGLSFQPGISFTARADADNSGVGSFSVDNTENIISTQGAGVNISGANVAIGEIETSGGAIDLNSTNGDTSFTLLNSGGGEININAIAAVGSGYGDVFGTSIGSQGGNVTVSATDELTISEIDSGTGNITLTGDEINLQFFGDGNFPGTVTGSGNLVLQPITPGRAIAIGGDSGDFETDTTLNLSDLDLEAIRSNTNPAGFNSITIGNANGSGAATVLGSSAPLFSDPVTIQSPLGSVTVSGTLVTNDNASVTINGPTTFNQRIIENPEGPSTVLNPGITTADQNIIINGNTTLSADTTLDTGATGGGNILLNGTVNGGSGLTIEAGTGQATFADAIGNSVPLTSLTVNSAATLNGNSITTTESQFYQGPLTLGAETTTLIGNGISAGNITSNGGDISLRSTGDIGGSVSFGTIDSGGGNIDIDAIELVGSGYGIVEGSIIESAGGNVNVSATNGIGINAITNGGNITLSGGSITLGGAVNNPNAITGNGDLILQAPTGPITLNGDIRIRGDNSVTITGESFAIGLDAEDAADLAAIQQGDVPVSELEDFVSGLDTLIQTQGGNVRITATEGGILAGRINTNGGNATLTASGTVVPDNDTNFDTPSGGIIFNTIDSEGGNIRANATGVGPLGGAIGFSAIDSGDGNVTLNAQGTGPQAGGIGFETIDSGSGDIEITAVAGENSAIAGRTLQSQGGDVTVFGTGSEFSIDIGEINSADGDVSIRGGGDTDVRTPTISAGSGDITIAADEINFDQGRITGTGNLTLQPFTTDLDIFVGSAPGSDGEALDLTTTDLDAIQDGFNLIRIGRENGEGLITVFGRNTPLFRDPVLIRSPEADGSIDIQNTLIGTDNASITLEGSTTFSPGGNPTSGIRTAGQDITINGDTTLSHNTALNTGSNDGNITLNGTVNGNSALRLNAGGQVAVNDAIGNEDPLAELSIDASEDVTLGAPINTIGDIDVIGDSIQPGAENGTRLNTTGGNVDLTSRDGDIEVETIATQGGDITVDSDRFFRATGTLGQDSPRNTSIDSGGGSISIRHAGGEREDPVEPFVVGDASENGTAGNITTGSNTIRTDRSIPGDFTVGNIDIETDDIPDDFEVPDEVSRADLVDPEESVETPGITPGFNLPIILGAVAAVEDSTCREFQRYFGSETFGELAGGQNPCERVRTPEEITAILGDIAAQAGRRAAIIYLIDAPEQLELVVFFPQGQPVRRVIPEANREALLAVVQEFRTEVAPLTANGGVDVEKLNSTSYLASAQQLYEWLIAPLKSELQSRDIDTLAFIPSAGLRSLPLSALHDGEQFLVEQYSVGLLPSINLIDPRYQSLQDSEILAVGSGEWAERGFELSDLPSVPIEVAAVVQQPWQGEVLLNEQFTLPQIVGELENPSFRILHLATHGEFLPGQPNNSYVQLWNTRLGLTQLRQLQRNQPPVELLTLSACRTALGDESAELGFAGLALASGAKSSLASLWYVSDIGTLSLMTEFYRQLHQVPIKAEALQQTQIAMLRGEVRLQDNQLYGPTGVLQLSDSEAAELTTQLEAFGVDDLSHPFFWSAFTMVGSPW